MTRFILGALACIFCTHAFAQAPVYQQVDFKREHIKSVAIVAPEWEGYSNRDGTGLYWDILRNVYEPIGIKVKHKTVPWNRAMKMVSKYRVFNGIIGEYKETEEQVIFPNYPIDVEYLSVLSKSDPSTRFNDNSSLSGKRVGWIKDYELIPEDKRDFTLKEFRSIEQGIQMLVDGQLDFVIDEWDEVAAGMAKLNLSTQEYSLDNMPEGTDVFVAFSIDDLSRELINIYNERIEELVASGEMRKIYEKWDLGEMPEALIRLESAITQ